jgi:hypothetical protein
VTPFPMLSATDKPFYPTDGRCPVCNGGFEQGMAYISGGALLLSSDGRNSIHPERLQGFLHVGIHGRDPDMQDSADVPIVAHLHGGQFDLQWCSIRCMREWVTMLLQRVESMASGHIDTGEP